MKPFFQMPTAQYDAIDAIRPSRASHVLVSPLHYLHAMHGPRTSTKSTDLGGATHLAFLEPHRFADEVAVFTGARRAGKEWDKFELENAGKIILNAADHARIGAMLSALNQNPEAKESLIAHAKPENVEVAMTWTNEATGLKCKGRMDVFDDNLIVGFKTSRSAHPRTFPRHAWSFGYQVQWGAYVDGVETLSGKPVRDIIEVVVESKAPHSVMVYRINAEVRGLCRAEWVRALTLIKECQEKKEWPTYAPGIVDLEPPAFATLDVADDVELSLDGGAL